MLDVAYKLGSALALQEQGVEAPTVDAFLSEVRGLDKIPHQEASLADQDGDEKEPDINGPETWDSPVQLKSPPEVL